MQFVTPSIKVGPNLNHFKKFFCLNFMKIKNKSCLVQQMTEKIAVEVYAKIHLGKKCSNQQKYFFKCIFYPFQKGWTQFETIF